LATNPPIRAKLPVRQDCQFHGLDADFDEA
jgi:hypothetical protein